MENKKIIFLTPSLAGGGGEKRISEQTLNFPDNIKKTIILFENVISYPYSGKLIFLNIPPAKALFKKIYYFLFALFKCRKIAKQERPDYVTSCGWKQGLISLLMRGRPIFLFGALSQSYNNFWGRIDKFLLRMLFSIRNPILVAPSKGTKIDIAENFGIPEDKIQVIYNPINIGKIQTLSREPLERKYQAIFNNLTIINIGRLSKEKGQWCLIRAFSEAKKKVKGLRLVIIGEGELRGKLEKLIRELGLENEVFLLGWQENPYKFLANSRFFISSSLSESLPTAVLEAMSCGLPIVSANCKGGIREILAPDSNLRHQADNIEYAQYGILTPPLDSRFYRDEDPLTRSEKFLSEAISKMAEDKGLRENLAQRSRERVKEFDLKKNIKAWNQLINE